MLRWACTVATARGIRIVAPVHDAILVEAPTDQMPAVLAETQEIMADASAAVLGGFRLRTDAKVIHSPDRYSDPRGARMWATVMRLLDG